MVSACDLHKGFVNRFLAGWCCCLYLVLLMGRGLPFVGFAASLLSCRDSRLWSKPVGSTVKRLQFSDTHRFSSKWGSSPHRFIIRFSLSGRVFCISLYWPGMAVG